MKSTLALALALLVLWTFPATAWCQAKPGRPAPSYLGQDGNGQPFELAHHRGKVVIAAFWASWCGPCRKELPYLEGLQKVLGPDKVKVIAISIEDHKAFRNLQRAAGNLSMEFVDDADGSVSRAYGRKGVPHLLVIGKDGTLLRRFVGYSEEQIDAIISQVQQALDS